MSDVESTTDDLLATGAPPEGALATRVVEPVDLPETPYTKSVLRIRVPLTVVLASARQPVSRILELGPGSIINFDKTCDQALDVFVGGYRIAEGEAVKVGDKFGVRIIALTSRNEQFSAVD